MLRERSFTVSFFISLVVHAHLLLSYSVLKHHYLKVFPLYLDLEPVEQPVVFDLVEVKEIIETAEDARSEKKPETAEYFSDKNAIARDRYIDPSKKSGMPFSWGDTETENPEVPFLGGRGRAQKSSRRSGQRSSARSTSYKKSGMVGTEQIRLPEMEEEQGIARRGDGIKEFGMTFRSSQRQQAARSAELLPRHHNPESRAPKRGGLSFNTYDWDYAPYMFELKRSVERRLRPPPLFNMGKISGSALLKFRILRDGVIQKIEVMDYTGDESLRDASIKAVRAAAPFRSLPENFPKDYLEITYSFIYQVLRTR